MHQSPELDADDLQCLRPLKLDLNLAGEVLRDLFPWALDEVTSVHFEHSPGRNFNKRAIFTAASHAQRAADYLHQLQPGAADEMAAEGIQESEYSFIGPTEESPCK